MSTREFLHTCDCGRDLRVDVTTPDGLITGVSVGFTAIARPGRVKRLATWLLGLLDPPAPAPVGSIEEDLAEHNRLMADIVATEEAHYIPGVGLRRSSDFITPEERQKISDYYAARRLHYGIPDDA